ncbi:phage tail tape measure protein [uncultured Flavobacterium sp.]|uniref:phage tail tape measure protein n=1 Tax=uncultured Flavobacterium sp. TaxID=165435 RepID=UPI0025CF61D9|nr:phage tail tape measure protein [uncultured Flavobacterium sp.]
MGLATINIKFTADLRGFSTAMQNSMRRIGQFGAEMTAMGKSMSMYVTAPLLAGGAAAIKFASDYEESLNKVDVAFGESSSHVKNFAKDTLETFGIAEGTALDMAAAYGDMGTAMGMTQEKAAKMSTSLVGLAGDIASFKNIGIDQANTALQSIFTGETESLKKLGIVMTEQNLQEFALSKGIKTRMKDMDQASKVNLRYAYVMSASANAVGDFERTGGGASNQMRIFQESLKQVAQQFGAVILPAFTKAITYVNSLVKSFAGLSTETKTTIVSIAAVAASIGPLLTVMGSLMTFVPNVITKFNALKDAWLGLQAVLVANPFTAIAVGLVTIASILLISGSRFRDLTNAQKDFASVNKVAAESIVDETTALNKNLAIAKNKSFSDATRKKAIEDLNALSPEYLGNITLENLYTAQTTEAVKKYTDAILQKAKVQAAEEKLVEVQKRLLELQMGNLNAVKPSVWQNLGNAFLSAGNSAAFASLNAKTVAKNLAIEASEAQKLIDMLTLFIGKNKETAASTDVVADALANISSVATEGFKAGTVAFYEHQIEGLQKLQKEIPTTNAAWLEYEKQIESIQKKIDALENKNIKLKRPDLPPIDDTPPPAFSLGDLKDRLAYFERQRELFSTTSEEYKKLTGQINNTKIKIDAIEGSEELKTDLDDLKNRATVLAETISASVQPVITDAFSRIGDSLSNSLGKSETALGRFAGAMVKMVVDLAAVVARQIVVNQAMAMSNAITGATASGSATGPAAIFTTPAFIATAIAGVLAAFAAIPRFETGGIFGGSSYYGDKILARVNSGEMVANSEQQRAIWNAMSSGGSSAGLIIPSVRIKGSDLLIVFDRANNRKNRIG